MLIKRINFPSFRIDPLKEIDEQIQKKTNIKNYYLHKTENYFVLIQKRNKKEEIENKNENFNFRDKVEKIKKCLNGEKIDFQLKREDIQEITKNILLKDEKI